MTFRMAGCPGGKVGHSAGAIIADRVPVTWRWLGRTHVSEVPVRFRATSRACRAASRPSPESGATGRSTG
jgi:hypothetical protein